MDILLVHESKDFREVIGFALEASFEMTVNHLESVHQAFDFLVEQKPVDLIICENSESNSKLFKFLLSVESPILFILIDSADAKAPTDFPDLKVLAHVPREDLVENLKRQMREAITLGVFKPSAEESEYCRIKTELLLKVTPLEADIFIRLSKIKFVRLFLKGDVFEKADLERYLKQKGVAHLYLKKADSVEFVKKFTGVLSQLVKREGMPQFAVPGLAITVHEAVRELSGRLGFTPEVQHLVQENINTVVAGVRKNDSLKELLDRVCRDSKSYLSAHSVMCAHVSCAIAMNMQWGSDTTLQKLTYAAFFHDITIEDQALAMIDTTEEMKEKRHMFTESQVKTFFQHYQEAAERTKQFSEIPPDVDTILVQHHERPDGTGFPRKLNSLTLSPLAAIFILAHDVVQAYFKKKGSLDDVVNHYRANYRSGIYKKILDAMESETKAP